MVQGEMGGRWATYKTKLSYFMLLILVPQFPGCFSLNSEGLALLEFRSRVTADPLGALVNWNPDDRDPCLWSGVHCVDGVVQILDLNGLHLEGVLAPEVGNLTHLKALILFKNHFFGDIPKQFGWLGDLEVLDLRKNDLTGTIPSEIGQMHSLKRLLLSSNNFVGNIPLEVVQLDNLTELQFDKNLTPAIAAEFGCMNRKVGQCEWLSHLKSMRKDDSILTPIKRTIDHYFDLFSIFGKGSLWVGVDASSTHDNPLGPSKLHSIPNEHNAAGITRRKLVEESRNLAAIPYNGGEPLVDFSSAPISIGSGSFPAVPRQKNTSVPSQNPSDTIKSAGVSSAAVNQPMDKQASKSGNSENAWKYIVGISVGVLLLFALVTMLIVTYGRVTKDIRPWKSGLSGQLQKAFVTGVPKLNSSELETACEDFSNIVQVRDAVTVYKGTLSSGVEIAVASTAVTSLKDWTKHAEAAFRKKIASLSRVNHKNFVNLIGYCEENEPFVRMMVFEYAPNGSLFEHLHVKELEHLDWSARMRIIMGTGYCLQHLHTLTPPIHHSCLSSRAIYLTDDYAAKVVDLAFWADLLRKSKVSTESDLEHQELPPLEDADNDVYCFGLLMLETISGKLPHSDEYGSILNWGQPFLNDRNRISSLVDPTLKSFKSEELEIVCEIIQECIQKDVRKRPTMQEAVFRLRDNLNISPESATPRLSPLWWAELEILSSEAA